MVESLNLNIQYPKLTTQTSWFHKRLKERRYEICDGKLQRSQTIPDVTQKCGNYLTFEDFITCSDTYKGNPCKNVPEKYETFNAIADISGNTYYLCVLVRVCKKNAIISISKLTLH